MIKLMHQTATKGHDLWFKNLVQNALDKANSDNVVWVSHESVSINRKKRMQALKEKLQQ